MMTTDQKVELAKAIATELRARWEDTVKAEAGRRQRPPKGEELKFKRNEWIRWALYFRRHLDLLKALQLAEYLSRSAAVRTDPQRTARCIAQVMRARLNQLQGIPLGELAEVFGYVGRWLEWLNQECRL